MNIMNRPALKSSGTEVNRVPTNLRMLGIAFIVLKGLITLRIRKVFRFRLIGVRSIILKMKL